MLTGAFPFAAAGAAAGGLALAAVGAAAGVFAMRPRAAWKALRRPPPALALGALLLVWASASHLWSPYDKPDQIFKLLLLTPAFAMLVFAASALPAPLRAPARAAFLGASLAGLLFLGFEAATDGDFSYAYKRDVEGYDGVEPYVRGVVDRLLGRGASPLLMMAGPAMLMAWMRGDAAGRAAAGLIAVLAAIAAVSFNTDANVLAIGVAGLGAACALAAPGWTLRAAFAGAGAVVLLTPVLLPAVIALLPEAVRESMPTSWLQRLHIWEYGLERVAEKPFFGWGLDAARVLGAPAEVRGIAFDLMPLHAHNAGLHIWVETGLAGAGLAAAALFALAGRRWRMDGRRAAALVWPLLVWFCCVEAGYGVWQEWHHGALALALAGACLIPRDERAMKA